MLKNALVLAHFLTQCPAFSISPAAQPYVECARTALWETGKAPFGGLGEMRPIFGPLTVLEERARPTRPGDFAENKYGRNVAIQGALVKDKNEKGPPSLTYFLPSEERWPNGLEKGFYVAHQDKVYFYELPKQEPHKGIVNRWFLNLTIPGTTKSFFLKYDSLPESELKTKYYEEHPNTYPSIEHIAPSYYSYDTGKPVLAKGYVAGGEQQVTGREVKDPGPVLKKISNLVIAETPKHLLEGIARSHRALDLYAKSIEDYRQSPLAEPNPEPTGDEPYDAEVEFQKRLDRLAGEAKDYAKALMPCLDSGAGPLVQAATETKKGITKLLARIDTFRKPATKGTQKGSHEPK